ncbi:BfmA/BtgA family mobilization protein [Spirosoma gilvum]
MEVKANKSVRFDSDTDLKFSKLSEKLGRSKQELFGQMVDYFYKSKKDPADLNDELLKKELGQGINRIISFIKTQEKEALSPMLADLAQLQRNLNRLNSQYEPFFQQDDQQQVSGFFIHTQRRLLKEHQTQQDQQANMVQKLDKLLEETRTHRNEVNAQVKTKESLKARFVAILNHYILHREQLNALTQGRLIKELQENAQSQVANL